MGQKVSKNHKIRSKRRRKGVDLLKRKILRMKNGSHLTARMNLHQSKNFHNNSRSQYSFFKKVTLCRLVIFSSVKKVLEQLLRTRLFTEFEIPGPLFRCYIAGGKRAGFSNPVKNRVLESFSNIFSPLNVVLRDRYNF